MIKNIKSKKHIFKNREDASSKLIADLPKNILKPNETVILAVSEGGVYFADKIAQALGVRMDLLLSEPIYSPVNPSLTIAMIGETEELVMHKALIDTFNISKDYIYSEAYHRYSKEILYYLQKYRNGKTLCGLNNKFVVLVDECAETGLTMMTAVKTAISLGAKNVFIAVPILDNVVYENLIKVCDNLFCPHRIDDYISIEYYYEELNEFSFKEIDEVIKKRNS